MKRHFSCFYSTTRKMIHLSTRILVSIVPTLLFCTSVSTSCNFIFDLYDKSVCFVILTHLLTARWSVLFACTLPVKTAALQSAYCTVFYCAHSCLSWLTDTACASSVLHPSTFSVHILTVRVWVTLWVHIFCSWVPSYVMVSDSVMASFVWGCLASCLARLYSNELS